MNWLQKWRRFKDSFYIKLPNPIRKGECLVLFYVSEYSKKEYIKVGHLRIRYNWLEKL